MQNVNVKIPVGDKGQVSGIMSIPNDLATGGVNAAIFAHGAANDMHNPLIVAD